MEVPRRRHAVSVSVQKGRPEPLPGDQYDASPPPTRSRPGNAWASATEEVRKRGPGEHRVRSGHRSRDEGAPRLSAPWGRTGRFKPPLHHPPIRLLPDPQGIDRPLGLPRGRRPTPECLRFGSPTHHPLDGWPTTPLTSGPVSRIVSGRSVRGT